MTTETAFTPISVTSEDATFIASRLTSHAKAQRKKLANAIRKALHPRLIQKLEADIAECTRLVEALKVTP